MPVKARHPLLLLPVFCMLFLGLVLPMKVQAQEVQLEQRVFEIARQLRCPVCTSESVADSNAEISVQMRQLIQEQLQAGKSDAEIIAYFQERYGDWIMLDPPKRGLHLLVWLLPVLAGLMGIAALAFIIKRWVARSHAPIEVNQADVERVRDALNQGS